MGEVRQLQDLSKKPPLWLLDFSSQRLLEILGSAGGEGRFVGGCVRDALLGQCSADMDVATDLSPEKVTEVLAQQDVHVIPTGLKHGTITAILNDRKFEITTLRHDVETDGRHADVAFTANWQEDAARRDFTFNALYLSGDGKLFDYFGGCADLAAGIVRFIGNPETRIEEDRLRVLRYFRFFARFGDGGADAAAIAACQKFANDLGLLSAERVGKEIFLLFEHKTPLAAILLMKDTGVLSALFGDAMDVDRLRNLLLLPATDDPLLRLGVLLAGDVRLVSQSLKTLRLSNKDRMRLENMSAIPFMATAAMKVQRAQLYRLGCQTYEDRLFLAWSAEPENPVFPACLELVHHWNIPVFPVQGRDLLSLDVKAGPGLGKMIKRLEAKWIASDFQLGKPELLSDVK